MKKEVQRILSRYAQECVTAVLSVFRMTKSDHWKVNLFVFTAEEKRRLKWTRDGGEQRVGGVFVVWMCERAWRAGR